MRGDTNLGVNYLSLMALAGAIAAAGLWTGMLHIIVGAMVIAPAFEPLMRIPFGLICGTREVSVRGAKSGAAGYLAMALARRSHRWCCEWWTRARRRTWSRANGSGSGPR
jgi:hypothetical protein